MGAMRQIVVGVDESAGAADALRWALAEAQLHDAELTAVMAWALLDQHHAEVGEPFDASYGDAEATAALGRYVAAAVGDQKARFVRTAVVCDLPARALLEASAGADLLVVGARGLGGFRGSSARSSKRRSPAGGSWSGSMARSRRSARSDGRSTRRVPARRSSMS